MSQLTHPRAQILHLRFRPRTWLAVVAAAVVIAIPTFLVVSLDDDSSNGSVQSAVAPGLRYDSGPDEGTRGLITNTGGATRSYSERSGDTFGARP
jgi:hypothetical protein